MNVVDVFQHMAFEKGKKKLDKEIKDSDVRKIMKNLI